MSLPDPNSPDRPAPAFDSAGISRTLGLVLCGALVLRLVLGLAFQSHGPDVQAFESWCLHIVRAGPTHFLSGEVMRQGAATVQPLYALLLWPLGLIWSLFDPSFSHWRSALFGLWIRLPSIVADLLCVAGLFAIARRYTKPKNALRIAGFLAWNPALILVSAIWGQPDSQGLALLLWGTYLMLEGSWFAGVLTLGATGLLTLHSLVFLPLALALAFARRRLRAALAAVAALAALAAVLGLALGSGNVLEPWVTMATSEPVTTADAFNLWWPLGNRASDAEALFKGVDLSRHVCGLFFLSLVLAFGVVQVATTDDDASFLREMVLVSVGAFMVATRVHEGRLLGALGFLLLFPAHRRSYHLFSLSLAANVLWTLGASPAWGKAVEGGWGAFLAVANLILYVQLWTLRDEDASVHLASDRPEPEPEPDPQPEPETSSIVRLDGRDLILVVLLVLAFGFLRLHRLATPSELLFDEVYHAKAGEEIYQGKAPNEWVHPPLAKLCIGLGIKAFGMNSFGWRFAPWLAGTLVLPFLYVLARNVIPDRRCAVFATLFFALDGCFFVLSRTAMTNVFAMLFQVATLTFFLLYLKQASAKGGRLGHGWYLLGTCLSISLAVSTRWTSLWLLALVANVYGFHTVFVLGRHTQGMTRGQKTGVFLLATASGILHFILVPLAIYFLSYWPLVAFKAYPDFHYVVSLQPQIWKFHTTFTTHHPYYSQWFNWSLLSRPVWYHYKDDAGMISGVIALGNPLLWWISVPAIVIAALLALRRRSWVALFPCAAWAGLYLPWVLSPRVLNYSHYYTEPLPHACVALGWLASIHWRRDRASRNEVVALVVAIALLFAFFFPLLTAVPIPRGSYDLRIWSRNWI